MVKLMLKYLKNKKATFDFWLAKKTINLDELIEVVDSDQLGIKIKKGRYAGVVFSYDDIKVREEEGAGGLLDFQTVIVSAPSHLKKDFINEKSFVSMVNDILRLLLIESIKIAEKKSEQRGTIDPDESVEEREVHEESASISEERVPARKRRKKTVQGDTELHSEVQQPTKRRSSKSNAPKRTKPD
jgi:hypothetical protein